MKCKDFIYLFYRGLTEDLSREDREKGDVHWNNCKHCRQIVHHIRECEDCQKTMAAYKMLEKMGVATVMARPDEKGNFMEKLHQVNPN